MKLFGLLLFLAAAGLSATPAVNVTVALPQDVITDYNTFVAAHGGDVYAVKDFKGAGSRRDVVEAVLFVQALKLGGLDGAVSFVAVDSYNRLLAEIKSGRIVASANPVWAADVAGDTGVVDLSPPVIVDGEFVVGMYTIPSNTKALGTTAKSLPGLSAISNKAWTKDWEALGSLRLKSVDSVATWDTMLKMVIGGRADFVLAPFSPKDDLSFDAGGQHFVPIPNLKVKFSGSRVFVSQRGSEVSKALAKGLSVLRTRGTVTKAYTDAGFFNPKVGSWILVNQ